MGKLISIPSARGLKSSFGDYAAGALGGLIFSLSTSVFGRGFIGSLVAPVLSGSMISGVRGQCLATVAGFEGMRSLMAGTTSNQASDVQVM